VKTRFDERAPIVMVELMEKFEFSAVQAAGVLGNIGHECSGFLHLREIGQKEGRGGYGWCQWTGPRRRSFLAWCDRMKLDWHTDEANMSYLVHELETDHSSTVAAMLKAQTIAAAARAFERNFERAGIPNYASRDKWAARAMRAYQERQKEQEYEEIPIA